MDAIESEGKNVNEAVENALKKMGLTRAQVEVQVLREPSSGFMGIGGKLAQVRIIEKHWGDKAPVVASGEISKRATRRDPPSEIQAPAKVVRQKPAMPSPQRQPTPTLKIAEKHTAAKEKQNKIIHASAEILPEAETLIKELLGLMGISGVSISSFWNSKQERAKISITGEEARPLIGMEGKTLESLQFIFNILLSRKSGKEAAVQVDALGYWESREKDVLANVERGVALVKSSGAPYRLPPMNAALRRIIHKTLADHPDVQTNSEGEGAWRKIVLRPRNRN